MESLAHEALAQRIAAQFKTTYNKGPGPDIETDILAIEVETPETLADAKWSLEGYEKPVFVAVTTYKGCLEAAEYYFGTDIGVIDNDGVMMKVSTRRRAAIRRECERSY